MKRERFLNAIQQFIARVAVSAGAPTRGKGSGGVGEKARLFLGERLNLTTFGIRDPKAFKRGLDRSTRQLMDALPTRLPERTRWALSRKLLNIFLRDCLYTTYLDEAYGLRAAEELFEIPLDLNTAKQIRKRARDLPQAPKLPQWNGVWQLTTDDYSAYQDAARLVAKSKDYGMARVHLDAYWWGERSQLRKDHSIGGLRG